jgi:hypothetical protein
MKKKIVFIIILMISVRSFSQKTFFSIGPELALPGSSYSLSTNAGTGFGGSFRFEAFLTNHISGMATIGYLGFAQKELPYSGTPPTTTRVKAVPVQIGMKYYVEGKKETSKGLFISAELGLMPTTTHFNYAVNPDFNFKETGFSGAPGIGYLIGNIEAGFRLQYNFTASGYKVYYYNFRLAYAFLKKKKVKS